MKKTLHSADETKFMFHTYDPVGRDVVIPVWAVSEELAWKSFKITYGNAPVDLVTK